MAKFDPPVLYSGASALWWRLGCALLLYCGVATGVAAEWHRQQVDIMGTRIAVELWHEDAQAARRCSEAVFTEMRRIDARMSTYRESSELSRINAGASDGAVEISAELRHLVERSLHFSRISRGAFDITYASVGYRYDYRQRQQPDEAWLGRQLSAVDYRHVELGDGSIRFRAPGVRIDLGGIAKGYAVDRAVELLRGCRVARAMVSAGGDSRIVGDRDGRDWVIGIKHPRNPDAIALRLPLRDIAVSTSGDYERFFIDDGERVHHIIDPKTGRSAGLSWSATVIGPDAMTTDALSTTIFILGAVEGLALIESLAEIDAIIIDSNGKVHYSSGFQDPAATE